MNERVIQMLAEGTVDTVYMTLVSTLFGYIIGLPVGVILTVSDKDGIKPNAVLYRILDVIINIMRSIPFLILLILLIPFTRFLVGKSYGTTATIVPLTISAAPYIARMVESSLKEVSPGVIEAARSMGASNWTIVFRVRGKDFSDRRRDHHTGNHPRLFRHGGNRRRRRTRRYRDPLRL